ncbi:MAG: CHASE domain-containing protein [Rhodoferax sp.]|uniref:CHASE domain-containing protein n=1 Tax=Rhodoferax sp. TaxID=50421 RepID=UPI0026167700|nr:CHASE domain-containing protein [Rhodoferax sp.]MDD2881862.1 CHASE domain-containing protein [Rhodoferax sp.]
MHDVDARAAGGQCQFFWPPAGIALGAFMLLGWRASAGVWLGAIATHGLFITDEINLHAMMSLVLMASGSTAQAAMAAWFSGRWLGLGQFATPASEQRMLHLTPLRLATVMAVLFALASTVAASIGTASLVLSGEAQRSAAAQVWQTWWLGDLAGMLGIGPLLYFLVSYWRKNSFQRDPIAICLACLLAGAGVLAFAVSQQSYRLGQQAALETDLDELIALQDGLMHANMTQVVSLKALFEASDNVRLDEFQNFTAKLLAHNPLIRSMSWIPRVRASERTYFEQQIHQSGRPEFFIQERTADHKRMSAGLRSEYFPITYSMPLDSNTLVTGLDVSMDPVRWDAIEQARDGGTVVASAPVELLRTDESLPGVLIVAPVYRPGLPLSTIDQRRIAFAGVVVSAFSPNKQFSAIRRILNPNCQRRLNIEPPCRFNIEPGRVAEF